ncbi:MAG: hypothetical protein NC489_27225, partial [Ruminococcus flavefaciens]|nr:hypothetical protein [Ruminococcus flavefaciens]
MFLESILAATLLTTVPDIPAVQPPIITEAKFTVELDHQDLSWLKSTPVAIMGDSISTWKGLSIEGGSEPCYPDNNVTDFSQM